MCSDSIGVALLSALYAWQANEIARRADDRAAGKIAAEFEIVTHIDSNEQRLHNSPWVEGPAGHPNGLLLKGLDDLRDLDPGLLIRNTGTEPIEALRVTIRSWAWNLVDRGDQLDDRPVEPPPHYYPRAQHVIVPLPQKLLTGGVAAVALTPEVLGQMLQVQADNPDVVHHFGMFEMTCGARIVGASSFDEPERSAPVTRCFVWEQGGFPTEPCREYLQSGERTLEVMNPSAPGR